jgi:uncharacterized membrane protein YraQ (UPF0718 family)
LNVGIAIDFLRGILYESWVILNDSAPYVLLGFLVAALLKAFLPDAVVAKQLGKKGAGSVVKAAILGIPIPLCSCGVVPAAMGLRKQGASRGATSSFLVSTPETGVDSIAITWALMDPVMTIFRPVTAFVTAMIAGFMENWFGTPDTPEITDSVTECGRTDGCCAADEAVIQSAKPVGERIRTSFDFAFGELLADIGKWLLVGIVLAGIVAYAVPDNFFEKYLGQGFVAMLVMLIAGIPLYICATSSTPFAAAMILKGLSPGAALVFLIAGPATNAATMTVVYKFLGARSLAIYLGSIATAALAFGWLLDRFYHRIGIKMIPSIGCVDCESPGWFSIVMSIILILLIARSIYLESRRT